MTSWQSRWRHDNRQVRVNIDATLVAIFRITYDITAKNNCKVCDVCSLACKIKVLISILCKNLRNWQEVGHDMSWKLLIFIYMAQLTPHIVNPSIVYHLWYRLPWKRVHPNFRLWEPVNLADFCLTWGKISAFLITTTTLVSLLLYSTSCCVKFLIILNATDQ